MIATLDQETPALSTDHPFVSLVIPVLNETACLPKLYEELRQVCDRLPYRFEFLFVDDGSTDATPALLAQLHGQDQRVRFLVLSRNFGHQAALSAGLAHAAGEAVIMMDGDLQHPPALIPVLLRRWQEGYDIVNTIRQRTEAIHPIKALFSGLFYKFFNRLAHIEIRPEAADFRLMSRAAVDALNQSPERHRFLRGLVPWLGFRQTHVEFVAPSRWAGQAKYTFRRSLRLALDGITAFSFYPLRLMTVFGAIIVGLSILYGFWCLIQHLFGNTTVPGWTSLMLCVLFFGGCHLAVLGVLGEYIGRILEQVKGRPLYIVRDSAGIAAPVSGPFPERPISTGALPRTLSRKG